MTFKPFANASEQGAPLLKGSPRLVEVQRSLSNRTPTTM
jgi:hypothetical protein